MSQKAIQARFPASLAAISGTLFVGALTNSPLNWARFSPGRFSLARALALPKTTAAQLQTRYQQRADFVQQTIYGGSSLAWVAFVDILFFFGVLLVGFAYLWKRGDLDWVRSTAAQREVPRLSTNGDARPREQLVVLSKD